MIITDRLLLLGLKIRDITGPIEIGNLVIYPDYDIRNVFDGYDEDKVLQIIEAGAKYGEISVESRCYEHNIFAHPLSALRLSKAGWLVFKSLMPFQKSDEKPSLELDAPPFNQSWSDSMYYEISASDIPKIQNLNRKLTRIPKGFLEIAIERFNRSYDYWLYDSLDDCLVDLVAALESIASGGGGSVEQGMSLRVSLLLADKPSERMELQHKMRKFYNLRSEIRKKGQVTANGFRERYQSIAELRSITRKMISISIDILYSPVALGSKLPKTMAEAIDEYIHGKMSH
jgi:hypothetical protein